MPDPEIAGDRADEVEDVVQLGLAAVHQGELWVILVRRELEGAIAQDPERAAALGRELEAARGSVAKVRAPVMRLAARAQQLGVGAPRSGSRA